MRALANRWQDARLRLLVLVGTLQVLGQTVFGFKLSIAQILITVAACGLIEVSVVLARGRRLLWPSSAMQTGNSIALLLRTAGTRHGDWWSLNGIEWFLLASAIAMGSKFLIRPGGRHNFNPSNIGIVLCLLLVGVTAAFPQYLWWGGPEQQLIAWLVIAGGAWWVLRGLRMVPMVLAFAIPFSLFVGLYAAAGTCFVAIWHAGPVCGGEYWAAVGASPELAIFVLLMMSDPKTAPVSAPARAAYGAATAIVAGVLIPFQGTEFGIKLALLSALTVVCGLRPAIEWLGRTAPGDLFRPGRLIRRMGGLGNPTIVAIGVIAFIVPTAVMNLRNNQRLTSIESGQSSLGRGAQ